MFGGNNYIHEPCYSLNTTLVCMIRSRVIQEVDGIVLYPLH